MAVVLPSEDDSYFSSALRRSHSQPRFEVNNSKLHASASTSQLSDLLSHSPAVSPGSVLSTPLSPPVTSTDSTYLSDSWTPATNSSLASDCEEASATPDDVTPPRYDGGDYFSHMGSQEPPSSPRNGDSDSSASDQDDSAAISRPGSPLLQDRAEDDIAVRAQPSRHVDYLSHNWREEDIWSSWKHIVSRRGDYHNAARLENASWRTWMKSKNKLDTVPPETLNWLKDYDVTWLYGPLQTSAASADHTSDCSNSARISKSGSFINKKPILKKRSMSEIMLQRSLSTSSLVKQAAAAVQAQQKGGMRRIGRRPGVERAPAEYITFPFSSCGPSDGGTSRYPSTRSSGVGSPSSGRKHIHFNEQVAQCIAVDVKGDDDDDDEADADRYRYDSDSDDGGIMMKASQSRKKRPALKKKRSHGNSRESKTIAMLPSTTLKYREETPQPTASATTRSPVLSPSSSQETLRPPRTPGRIYFAGDEDDEGDDESTPRVNIRPGAFPGRQYSEGGSGLRRAASSTSLSGGSTGMRRTTSGMFMPADSMASVGPDDGLLGQILTTVNTARDIAHVIWNVGWRN